MAWYSCFFFQITYTSAVWSFDEFMQISSISRVIPSAPLSSLFCWDPRKKSHRVQLHIPCKKNTCLPKWCVCHHELFSGCWQWESESIPQKLKSQFQWYRYDIPLNCCCYCNNHFGWGLTGSVFCSVIQAVWHILGQCDEFNSLLVNHGCLIPLQANWIFEDRFLIYL